MVFSFYQYDNFGQYNNLYKHDAYYQIYPVRSKAEALEGIMNAGAVIADSINRRKGDEHLEKLIMILGQQMSDLRKEWLQKLKEVETLQSKINDLERIIVENNKKNDLREKQMQEAKRETEETKKNLNELQNKYENSQQEAESLKQKVSQGEIERNLLKQQVADGEEKAQKLEEDQIAMQMKMQEYKEAKDKSDVEAKELREKLKKMEREKKIFERQSKEAYAKLQREFDIQKKKNKKFEQEIKDSKYAMCDMMAFFNNKIRALENQLDKDRLPSVEQPKSRKCKSDSSNSSDPCCSKTLPDSESEIDDDVEVLSKSECTSE